MPSVIAQFVRNHCVGSRTMPYADVAVDINPDVKSVCPPILKTRRSSLSSATESSKIDVHNSESDVRAKLGESVSPGHALRKTQSIVVPSYTEIFVVCPRAMTCFTDLLSSGIQAVPSTFQWEHAITLHELPLKLWAHVRNPGSCVLLHIARHPSVPTTDFSETHATDRPQHSGAMPRVCI